VGGEAQHVIGTPQELRATLAGVLAARAGLPPGGVAARAAAARDDPAFAEAVVQALVGGGAWIVEDPGARRVRLEEIDALPALQEVEDALDRRRARPLSTEQCLRVARLYALIKRDEKGAACYRELLARREPVPLSMAIEVAESAGRAGAHALALAGIDRVAETVLTRDPNGEGASDDADILREDPLGAGALLERARDIALTIGHAPRAVALARAATALYERLGRRQEARESLAGQARALQAAGRSKRARQVAERWRELAAEDGAVASEARAVGWLAGEAAAEGMLRAAADLHQDAVDLLVDADDLVRALAHARKRAELLERGGALEDARAALARALAIADELGAERPDEADPQHALALRLDAARLDLALGDLAQAIAGAGAVRATQLARDDAGRAASAATVLVDALIAAGDLAGARDVLGEVTPVLARLDDPAANGRARRARAELDALDGRVREAGWMLHDAAASFSHAGAEAEAAQCLLRRAELLAAAGDRDACRQELKRALELTGTLAPCLELRMELLRALLAPPEEAHLLLEEVAERAPTEGDPWVRAAVAAARARRGDGALATEGLTLAAAELRKIRDALPEPLRAGFASSPWARAVVEAGAAVGVPISL
jgi:hypothetical protein